MEMQFKHAPGLQKQMIKFDSPALFTKIYTRQKTIIFCILINTYIYIFIHKRNASASFTSDTIYIVYR